MEIDKIILAQKYNCFNDLWSPKIISELNDQYIKLAKVKNTMIWHSHPDEDELFIVQKGALIMELKDKTIEVSPGEILVIPKGVEHRPRTNGEEVWIMLIEPKSTKNTGDDNHAMTIDELDWI